jgi:hypothetical protein
MISAADEALLYKFEGEHYTLIGVATDNFTIVGDSDSSINLLKQQLSEHWEISDLGPINWLLGVGITCNVQA